MSEKLTCPRCGGEGLIEVYNEAGCPYPQRDTCPRCGGRGVVSYEEADKTMTILAHTCPPKHGSCEASHETLRNSARRLDMDDTKCCHDCWRDYLVSEGKEAPTHA